MMKMESVEPDASSRNPRGAQAVVSLLNHHPVHPPGSDLAPPAVPYNQSVPQPLPPPPHPSPHHPPPHVTHHPYSNSNPSPPNNYSHSRQPTPQQQQFPPQPQYSPRPPSDPRSAISHPPPPSHGPAVGPHPSTSTSYTPIESRPPPGAPNGGPPSSVNEHPAARPQLGLHTAPMEQQGAHPGYEQPPQMNGNGTAGYSHMESPHQYGSHHMTHPQSYAASPVSAHPYSGQYASQYSGMPKKKHVRAQQACNNCRQRKQKCDEQKPCQFCKENNMECAYKDVPPPKSDRTMMQILERLTAIEEKVGSPNAGGLERLEKRLSDLERRRNSTNSQPGSISTTTTPPTIAATVGATDARPPRAEPQATPNPEDHKTGAHYLQQDWPSISRFFKDVKMAQSNYPLELEEKRGSLRLYGTGEGLTSSDIGQQIGSSPESDSSKEKEQESPASFQSPDSNPTPSSHEGIYCNGFPQGFGRHLDFSPEKVRTLHKSYIENTYGFHPFLDKGRLSKQIETFIKKMNPTEQIAKSPHIPIGERPNKKRKAEEASGDPAQFPLSGTHEALKIESTITNAIILLVLALGAITLEKDPLTGPHPDKNTQFPCVRSDEAEYAAGLTNLRPAGVPASLDNEPPAKRQKLLYDLHNKDSDRSKGDLNMNVIPGMAYYAYASDILGNMHCGNEIFHAQAFLLASLYINQLGRCLESYSWINSAARVIRILVRLERQHLTPYAPLRQQGLSGAEITRIELIKFTFWSALQLESDILAELSLPPSHITDYEPIVGYPQGIDDSAHAAFEENIQFLYSAQIFIRKNLNYVRDNLYGKQRSPVSGGKSDYYPDQVLAEAVQTTLDKMLNWRAGSTQAFQWKDSDPPTQNLNLARLRGKFYGAVYITTRPFLQSVLHCDPGHHPMLKIAWDYIQRCPPNTIDPLTEPQHFPNVPGFDLSRIHPGAITAMLMVQKCISCAVASTKAFDNIEGRWKVTNIFGTLHAQFGNCLVLSAVYSSWLSELKGLLPRSEIGGLLKGCIKKCITNQHLCPALGLDAQILRNALDWVSQSKSDDPASTSFSHPQHEIPYHQSNDMQRSYSHQPVSASSSFSA